MRLSQLSLITRPRLRETLPSFVSRLAAVNGLSFPEFATDMGFSLKRLCQCDDALLSRLAEIAALSDRGVAELLSWTGTSAGEVRTQFRDEVYVSRSLRNPIMRGCPKCLLADVAENPANPLQVMTYRGDWQFRDAQICCEHNHPLVPLWEEPILARRWDIQTQFYHLLEPLKSGGFDRPNTRPTKYDFWLDQRLKSGSDNTCLKGQRVFAATVFCRHLGMALGQDKDTASKASETGFDIASRGHGAIREALDGLAKRSGAGDGPQKAFGSLYPVLNRDYADLPEFDMFRDNLRACILDQWPVAAGERVLGRPLTERRLHSVNSAAKEAGIGPDLMNLILTGTGILDEGDDRPLSRKLFNAQHSASLIAEVPTWVGPQRMRDLLGASRAQFEGLVKARILVPTVQNAKVKSRWCAADALDLLDRLRSRAMLIDPDATWMRLDTAGQKIDGGLAKVLDLIWNGAVRLGQIPNAQGIGAFVVAKSKLAPFMATPKQADTTDVISAAAYGRRIGLRDKGLFLSLIRDGHTPAVVQMHPKTRKPTYVMTDEDIAAFQSRFVTLTMIARETGLHRNTIIRRLKDAGVEKFAPTGQGYGGLFLRSQIAPFFPKN